MKNLMIPLLLLLCFNPKAQKKILKTIDKEVSQAQLLSHINFIASDELLGRNTGTQENAIVTRYIAEQFKKFGLKKADGNDSYFQEFLLERTFPAKSGFIKIGDSTFTLWKDLIMLGNEPETTATFIYVDSSNIEKNLKYLKDKIVFSYFSSNSKIVENRNRILEEKPLFEIDVIRQFGTWYFILNRYSNVYISEHKQLGLKINRGYYLDNIKQSRIPFFERNSGKKATIYLEGGSSSLITANNVLGIVEGTNPILKKEYIIISAHLDHLGYATGLQADEDSVYNGARDNGIGTGNLLMAAEYFARHPTKRSILFVATNGEEKGLLGSKWFAENPAIPLKSVVANINTDCGGYNDTLSIIISGLEKTTMIDQIMKSGDAYDFEVRDEEIIMPGQNLYRRSDHFSFASKGIPAISFSPGSTGWDEEFEKYYHQTADNPETLNYSYLTKLSKAFVYSIYLIANQQEKPFWVEGDEFEEAGKALYGIN